MTFYMNLNVLGATLGMVASTTPERWARAPGPGPLEAEGRLLYASGIWDLGPMHGPLGPLAQKMGMGPLHGPLGPLALKKYMVLYRNWYDILYELV